MYLRIHKTNNESIGSYIKNFAIKNKIKEESSIIIYAAIACLTIFLITKNQTQSKLTLKKLKTGDNLKFKKLITKFSYKFIMKDEKDLSEKYLKYDDIENLVYDFLKNEKEKNFSLLPVEYLGKLFKYKSNVLYEHKFSENNVDESLTFLLGSIANEIINEKCDIKKHIVDQIDINGNVFEFEIELKAKI